MSAAQQAQQHNRDTGGRYAEGQLDDPGTDIGLTGAACCAECGNPMQLDDGEIATHIAPDGGIDYDLNADHVAVDDRSYSDLPLVPDYPVKQVFTALDRATEKPRRTRTITYPAPHENVLLDNGYAFTSDGYVAIRVRTPIADQADNMLVPAAEAKKAARVDGPTRPRLGGAWMEIGGQPVETVNDDTRTLNRILTAIQKDPATTPAEEWKAADLAKLARSETDTVTVFGWKVNPQNLAKAAAAVKDLRLATVQADLAEYDGYKSRRATLHLYGPGVDMWIVAVPRREHTTEGA